MADRAELEKQLAEQSARLARLEELLQAQEARDTGATRMSNEEIAEVSAKAAAVAHQSLNQRRDESEFPDISVFNPKGERLHPKEKLQRELYVCGMPLREDQLTPDEIAHLNQVKPGVYHRHDFTGRIVQAGYFKVREMDPGIPNGRLHILFPFKGEQAHATNRQYSRDRGMVDMLLEMIPKVAETVGA